MIVDRRAVVASALIIAALFSANLSGQEPAELSFGVKESALELGKVMAGQTLTAIFVFHNRGPDDVHIIRAKPS